MNWGWTKRFRPVQLAEPDPQPAAPPQTPDQELIAALAAQLGTRLTIKSVSATLLLAANVSELAVKMLLELEPIRALVKLGDTPALADSPIRLQHRQNLIRRATYLLNAARRLTTALVGPSPTGDPNRITDAIQRELGFLRLHVEASNRRMQAATRVADELVKENTRRNTTAGLTDFSPSLLGWYAVMDERTSTECRRANRRNFDPMQPPLIGYPGTVHPFCRCKPGPPHRTSLMVGDDLEPEPAEVEMAVEYVGRHRRLEPAIVDLVSSSAYPSLERKPGKQNWVDKAGGLPDYIERIAKHLHHEQGMSISHAIASAVNTVKKWAAGGGNVSAKTQAKAAAAVAQWEAKKAKARG